MTIKERINRALDEQEHLCHYWQTCHKSCSDDRPCGTKRFYDKYGSNWDQIGVGAMMTPVRRYGK